MLRDRMKSLYLHFSVKLKTLALLLGSSLIIFSFQNCGQAPSDSEGENASTLDAKMSNVPFAYDIVLNQITVNGCDPSVKSSTSSDFIIRAGAYDDPAKHVGLGLRKEFTDYVMSNYGRREDPTNPKSSMYVPQEMIQSILQTSPKNAEASLVIALTNGKDIEVEASTTSGIAPLGSLSQAGIVQPMSLLKINQRTSYFPDLSYTGLKIPRIERSIPTNIRGASGSIQGIAGLVSYASDLGSDVVLSSYFRDGDTVITSVDKKGNFQSGKFYGRNFSLDLNSVPTGSGSFQLRGVTEVVPSETSSSALPVWTCNSFPVVDPEDALNVCNPGIAGDTSFLASLRILRRHLSPDAWDIRQTAMGLCLVPVKNKYSCYGDAEKTPAMDSSGNVLKAPTTISPETVITQSECLNVGSSSTGNNFQVCQSPYDRLRLPTADELARGVVQSMPKGRCAIKSVTTAGNQVVTFVRCMRYVSVCTRASN